MFNNVMKCKRLINLVRFLVENNKKFVDSRTPLTFLVNNSSQSRSFSVFFNRGLLATNGQFQLSISRNKSKSKKRKQKHYVEDESSDEDEEEDDEFDASDEFSEKGVSMKTYIVNSIRIDSVLKKVLGSSRKEIEQSFYRNKIRLNGMVVLKKSYNVNEGDEIDLIKKFENLNDNTLNVARIKILRLKLNTDNDQFMLKVWRKKSMIIDNYKGANSWQEIEESEEEN